MSNSAQPVVQGQVVGVTNPGFNTAANAPAASEEKPNLCTWLRTPLVDLPVCKQCVTPLNLITLPIAIIVMIIMFVVKPFGEGDGNSGSSSGGSFVAGTRVQMHDGTWKRIEELDLGEHVAVGGRITGRMVFEASGDELYLYPAVQSIHYDGFKTTLLQSPGNLTVAGSHAVYDSGKWYRIRDAPRSIPVSMQSLPPALGKIRVYDVDVERHRLRVLPEAALINAHQVAAASLEAVGQKTQEQVGVIFADFSEVNLDHPLVDRFEQDLLKVLGGGVSEIEL